LQFKNSFFSLGPYQKPLYDGFDSSASKYASYTYENNQPVFTAEMGTRFYLKLYLTANPSPNSRDLHKNGIVLSPANWGDQHVINLTDDSVNIQSVQSTDAANYTISSSNSMGQGKYSFGLKVVGKVLFSLSFFFAHLV
jgi:hypothetical protein